MVLLLNLLVALQAAAWPDVQAPPGAAVVPVAQNMVLDGRRCRVYRVEVAGNEADVLRFYRQQIGPRHVENRIAGSQVLATRQGDYFHTIQVREIGPQRVQVTLMTTALEGGVAPAVHPNPLMPATTVPLSSMESHDDGKRSRMVIGANQISIRANRDHVVTALKAQGFHLVSENRNEITGRGALALVLVSTDEEALVTISNAGSYRSVLINQIKEAK